MLNQDGRRLVEHIYAFTEQKLHQSLLCEELHKSIELQLKGWQNDILVGPYIPTLFEICSEKRFLDDIAQQTIKFLFSYREETAYSSKQYLDFYDYLRTHQKIWPTPPLDKSFGFQCVRGKNSHSFSIIWEQGKVVLPDDKIIREYGLSDEHQNLIRIPLYRGNSDTINENEPGCELSFPIPPHLISKSGSIKQEKPKIRVSFQRYGRKDLKFQVDWVQKGEVFKIRSVILDDEFNQLAAQEDVGENSVKMWRQDLIQMIIFLADFIEACKKSNTAQEKLQRIQDKLEVKRIEAVKLLRMRNAKHEAGKMLKELIEIWLALGPKVLILSTAQFSDQIFGMMAPKALSDETQPIIDGIKDAYDRDNEDEMRQLLASLGEIYGDASASYYERREREYSQHELGKNIQQMTRIYHLMPQSLSQRARISERGYDGVQPLISLAETILSEYSDLLTTRQISKLENALNELTQALQAKLPESILVKLVEGLEAQLMHLGVPTTLAILHLLGEEYTTKYPIMAELYSIAQDKNRTNEEKVDVILDKLNKEGLKELNQVLGSIPHSEVGGVSFELDWLDRSIRFAMITNLPILTSDSEKLQFELLALKAAEFLARWKSHLSLGLAGRLEGLIQEAEEAEKSDEADHVDIVKELMFTLLEAGAIFVAYLVNSYTDRGERFSDRQLVRDEVNFLLESHRQNLLEEKADKPDSFAAKRLATHRLLKLASDKVEARYNKAVDQDMRLRVERRLLAGMNLAVVGKHEEAVSELQSMITTQIDDNDNADIFLDMVEKFLDSEESEYLSDEERNKLQSAFYSVRKSRTVEAKRLRGKVHELQDNLAYATAEVVVATIGQAIPNLRALVHNIITTRLPGDSEAADDLADMIENLIKMTIPEPQSSIVGLLLELDE